MSDNSETLSRFITNPTVRQKLCDSADRIRRTFDELFRGYDLRAENVLNEVVKVKNYSGIVSVENVHFYSFCEHHFAPFFGTAAVIYEPDEIVTGLGKLVRLVRDVHGP